MINIPSGQLRNITTEMCQKEMRLIDRVTVKGSIEPVGRNELIIEIKIFILLTCLIIHWMKKY